MVRCMMNGKVYEVCFAEKEMEEMMQTDVIDDSEVMEEEEVATEEEDEAWEEYPAETEKDDAAAAEGGGLSGGYHKDKPVSTLRCMMNGVIYYPGVKNVLEAEALREMAAAAWHTKIIEDHFDDLGHPRLKIVYVDIGDLTDPSQIAYFKASDYIGSIIKAEKEKEKREDRPRPRLIFVKQDRDYWPGSEEDPDVMARRTAKELRASSRCPWIELDEKMIWVPPTPEEEKLVPPPFFVDKEARRAYYDEVDRLNFLAYFDPSLPGTKFILDIMPKVQRDDAMRRYTEDPVLWKEWLRISGNETTPAAAGQ